MKNIIRLFSNVLRDVKLNNVPSRRPDGSYSWTHGQLDILKGYSFNKMKEFQLEIRQLSFRRESLLVDMLNMQNPASNIEQLGNKETRHLETATEKEENRFKNSKLELDQFEEDLFNRGICLPHQNDTDQTNRSEAKKKPRGLKLRAVLILIGIWFIVELFMTYAQWNSLREFKGIEGLVVRSLSFGVVLLMIHLVPHEISNFTKRIYYIFVGFCVLMLVIMLFAPLILYLIYPPETGFTTLQDQWTITGMMDSVQESPSSHYPLWVRFYMSFEVAPAVLCVLFYIIIYVSAQIQKKLRAEEPDAPVVESEHAGPRDSLADGLLKKREQLRAKIRECDTSIAKLKKEASDSLASNTESLNGILNILQSKKEEIFGIEERIADLKVEMECELKNVEKELDVYKTEYTDILRSDQTRSQYVTPEWPERIDVVNYYKV